MTTNNAPQLTFTDHGEITVGTISEANMLDAMNVTEFGNEVLNFLKGKQGIHLLLNFENVDYMSSAALTELLRINENLNKANGSVRLTGLTNDIRKVFQITNLEKLFVIHDDEAVDQAVSRFERALSIASEDDAWSAD
jgi:anti-sigma B factor antagonist